MRLIKTQVTEKLHRYVLDNSLREHPVLADARKQTQRMAEYDMQIPPLQGQLMALVAASIEATSILEIGTFTGYSSTVMALALPADGHITCCDRSEEFTDVARGYWRAAGVESKIELLLGDAEKTLGELLATGRADRYDLAFIDADKEGYDAYYEACLKLVRRGGLIMLDNMLWAGRVADPEATDADTVAIRAMNAKIHRDERVDQCLVPIGDGLTIVRRR